MKTACLILGVATLLAGCHTRKTVYVEEPPRRVIVSEPAGTPIRVYQAPTVYYGPSLKVYPYGSALGGNYPGPRR